MDHKKLQGIWISSQGLTNQDVIKAAYQRSTAQTKHDLCGILVDMPIFPLDVAEQVRSIVPSQAKEIAANSHLPNPPAHAQVKRDPFSGHLLQAGAVFQEYKLISELSRGAMGIMVAEHLEDARLVALKFIIDEKSVLSNRKRLSRAGDGFRLPNQHEWQHACKAGSQTGTFWATDAVTAKRYAWVWENCEGRLYSTKAHAKQHNAFGLSDMLGHVSEWSDVQWDDWIATVQRAVGDGRLSIKNAQNLRIMQEWKEYAAQMGGQSYWYGAWACSNFFCFAIENSDYGRVGFRVFISAPVGQQNR
jgi:hypothetical protein